MQSDGEEDGGERNLRSRAELREVQRSAKDDVVVVSGLSADVDDEVSPSFHLAAASYC